MVPAARARHLQAVRQGLRGDWDTPTGHTRATRLTDEHRVRTLLTCYRWYTLVWILPLALLYLLGESIIRLLQGRPGEAWQTIASFGGAVRSPGRLWRSRRRVQRRRQASDAAIRRLQTRGNARLRAYLRARVEDVREGLPPAPVATLLGAGRSGVRRSGRRPAPSTAGPGSATPWVGPAPGEAASTPRRVSIVVGIAILAVLLFGSRSLLGHGLPAIAQLPNTSAGWAAIWRSWWSTWQPSGLGVTAPTSPALALLGLLGTVLFGAVGVLQHVVVLGPLVLGPLGAYRAARWWGSRRGRLAAAIAYAIVPLPYNALARGHWPGLVAYAATPWVLSMLGRLSGEIPFPVTRAGRSGGRIIGLALLVAVTAAAVPSFLYVVPIMGLALAAGSALAGRPRQGWQMVVAAVGSSVVAFVLLLPWSATVLFSRTATLGLTPGPAGRLGLGQTLRFDTGPVGHGALGWALLVVAALPLIIGQGWRLEWAARLWTVAVVFFGLTWAGSRGWIPALPPEVGLAPAAAALAGAAALGAVAFELDLPGYRFGWRQLAAAVAGVALAVSSIPILIASGQGRWHLPSQDASSVLAFLPNNQAGDYRVLWVGAPDALALAARPFDPGIGVAASFDGEPGLADLWITGRAGATPVLATDLRLVENRLTTKLGHLLAPAAVRYIVVPNHNAPTGAGAAAVPIPASLLAGLPLQTDLQLVNADPNYTVYENAAWAPARTVLPQSAVPVAAASGIGATRQLQETDLSGAAPLGDQPVPAGSTVYVSATRESGWRLHQGGASVAPQPAFGWAMSFTVPATATGPPRVTKPSSVGLHAGQLIQIVLWIACISVAGIDLRRRRAEHPPSETVHPEWFAPMAPASSRAGWRRSLPGGLGAEDLKGDEVWIDV